MSNCGEVDSCDLMSDELKSQVNPTTGPGPASPLSNWQEVIRLHQLLGSQRPPGTGDQEMEREMGSRQFLSTATTLSLPDEGHKVENVTLTSILQTFSFLLPSILLLLSGMSCPTSSPSQGVSGKYFQILTLALLSRDTAGVNHVNVNFHETLLNGSWLYWEISCEEDRVDLLSVSGLHLHWKV